MILTDYWLPCKVSARIVISPRRSERRRGVLQRTKKKREGEGKKDKKQDCAVPEQMTANEVTRPSPRWIAK